MNIGKSAFLGHIEQPNRRLFLKTIASSTLLMGSSLFGMTQKDLDDFYAGDREIWLTRDNKSIKVVYYSGGRYVRNAYDDICYLLKDVHEDIAVEMDPLLIDVASYTMKWFSYNGINKPLRATSGYRTPMTNANTENASRNSEHLRGKALDGGVDGIGHEYLGMVASRVGGGGIGVYSTHTHIDTGAKRWWYR